VNGDLCSALRKRLLCAQEWHVLTTDHTDLLATHTFIHEWNEPFCLYSVSMHQMAPPERDSTHPITDYYSLIDLERMKG